MGRYTAAVQDHLVLPGRVSLTVGQGEVLRQSGRSPPLPVGVRLLIDTGSKRTSLAPLVIARLGAPLRGVVRAHTSLASAEASLYWVRLDFPETTLAAIPQLAVVGIPMPPRLRDFDGVVGRDVLSRWESLLYEGRRKRLTISDSRGRLWQWLWPHG